MEKYPIFSRRWLNLLAFLPSRRKSANPFPCASASLSKLSLHSATGLPSPSITSASAASSDDRSALTIVQNAGVLGGAAVGLKPSKLRLARYEATCWQPLRVVYQSHRSSQ